jgi:hypothetical protein
MYKSQKLFTAILILSVSLVACNGDTVKTKAENTVTNTGKLLGRGSAKFFKGVREGVDKTLNCQIELSENLKNSGLSTGKFFISQSKGASDNVLTVYLLFDRTINKKVSIRVYDRKGREYGRTSTVVEGNAGEANYIDFVFDPRTEIEAKSKFTLE